MRLPASARLSFAADLTIPNWAHYSALDKSLTIGLAASLIVATGTLSYVILAPGPRETFTEFYILGAGGSLSDYPANLTVNESGGVILGIANHEAESLNYTVRIDLIGTRIVYNVTSGSNELVEVNRTTWSVFSVLLADGRNWTKPYTFRISYAGLWKVHFMLFKDSDLSSAYRNLDLLIRVT